MSLIARFLCLLLLIPLIGSNSAPAQARNVPLVTGRYKYLPARVPAGLTLITTSRFTVKHRPAAYGLRHLSSRYLTNSISARSAMVMDAVSGDIIYTINPDLPRQPASTIKVLNGIISIDSLRKNDLVPVSRRAAGMPRSKVYLRPGHKYRAGDLINAMLLASANDASVALAEKIGGSERIFAKLMTARARSLGATHTICKSASGLTRRGQYTTARDLAKIFNYAMRNPIFARTMERTKIRTSYGKIIRSHNRALWQVNGAEGGKTGYTYMARQTYVGSFKRGNDELVVAIMGSETMWNDLKKLVRFGFAKKARIRRALALTRRRVQSFKLVRLGGRDTLAHFTTVQ